MYPQLVNPYMASATPAHQSLNVYPGAGALAAPGSSTAFVGQPARWWIGAFVLLVLLKVLSEHEDSKLDPAHIHVGGYDVAVLLTAWLFGWTAIKVLVNRFAPASSLAVYVNWV